MRLAIWLKSGLTSTKRCLLSFRWVEICTSGMLLPLEARASMSLLIFISTRLSWTLCSLEVYRACTPVLWSMAYLKLHALPALDVPKNAGLQWLAPHVSLTFSAPERKLQSDLSLRRLEGEHARLNLSLHSSQLSCISRDYRGTAAYIYFCSY